MALLNTVIFDMDGLLIDSEPLWKEAADETFAQYGVNLNEEQYKTTTGLRTREFVQWWFKQYNIGDEELNNAENTIIQIVLEKIKMKGKAMPGVEYIINFFKQRNFKMGIASSSPQALIDYTIQFLGIENYIHATSSAGNLNYGKPHPQVYLDCAKQLNVHVHQCLCFEDSFNGMIAAKAARMKCVIVPHASQIKDERWGAADLKISSLQNFGDLHLNLLNK